MLEQRLVSLLVIPINRTDIHAAYAEIQAYSQGKIATKPLGQSARNMGKNDLWIAATTHVLEASLLTADKDFQHLDQVYFPLELIER